MRIIFEIQMHYNLNMVNSSDGGERSPHVSEQLHEIISIGKTKNISNVYSHLNYNLCFVRNVKIKSVFISLLLN